MEHADNLEMQFNIETDDGKRDKYLSYLASQVEPIQRIIETYTINVTSPLAAPDARGRSPRANLAKGMSAKIYNLVCKAAKLQPLDSE